MGILKALKKAVKSALGNNGPSKPKVFGSMGPAGEDSNARRAAMTAQAGDQRRRRRGRDSTIMNNTADSYSRTLLG